MNSSDTHLDDRVRKERLSRRSHRKSRLGCDYCKGRRIKCDEVRPACSNCILRSLACSYRDSRPDPGIPSKGTRSLKATKEPLLFSNGTPPAFKNLLDVSSKSEIPSSSPVNHSQSREVYYYSDLELLHHYHSTTSQELGGGSFWCHELLQRGFENHCLLHMALTLSALHLSYREPARKRNILSDADRHYALAIPTTLSELSNPHAGNVQDLYISSILICLITLARGPSEGQYIAFCDDGVPEWLQLLKGVKMIRENFGHFFSPDKNDSDSIRGAATPKSVDASAFVDFRSQLSKIRNLIECMSAEEPVSSKYLLPLGTLGDCFVAHVEGPGNAENEQSQVIMSWLYNLPNDYLEALQAKKPVALILFAFYMVLVKQLERQWLFHGWSRHVMAGIYKHLHPSFCYHIDWPMAKIDFASSSGL